VNFDGNCRGNGSKNARAAVASYWGSYEHVLSKGEKVDAITNQQAEIIAATRVVTTICRLIENNVTWQECDFEIRGDSNTVVSCVVSGNITMFTFKPEQINSQLWSELQSALKEAEDCGAKLRWKWVPRRLNKEADELANAALDGREPNTSVKSCNPHTFASDAVLQEIFDLLRQARVRALRSIPPALKPLWIAVVHKVVDEYEINPVRCRMIFCLLPLVMSIGVRSIWVNSRDDFKRLRQHLHLLSWSSDYLYECLVELRDTLLSKRDALEDAQHDANVTGDQQSRIRAMCAKGAFHKCVSDNKTVIANAADKNTHKAMNERFPQLGKASLPDPLPEYDMEVNPYTYADLLRVTRRLKQNKAPGIFGWTRELWVPIVYTDRTYTQVHLSKIITDLANAQLSEHEKQLITLGCMLAFYYPEKKKYRGVVMYDCIVKLAWLLATDGIVDPNDEKTGQCFSIAGGSQNAVFAVQAALNDGRIVFSGDSQSAYQTCSRRHAFLYYRKFPRTFGKAYRLLNLFYSAMSQLVLYSNGKAVFKIDMDNGTRAGCVSGFFMYKASIMEVSLKWSLSIVQCCDDVNIIANGADGIADTIIQDFKGVSQHLDGDKMKFLIPSKNASPSVSPLTLTATLVRQPIKILGSFIVPCRTSAQQERTAIAPFLKEIEAKYRAVLQLPATLQERFFILRSLSWNYVYFAETCQLSIRQDIFAEIDDIHVNALEELLGKPKGFLAPYVDQVLAHVHEGGWGFLCYRSIGPFLWNRAVRRTAKYVASFGLPGFEELPITEDVSLVAEWRKHFSERIAGHRLKDLSLAASTFTAAPKYRSWLDQRPTNKITRLEDDCFRFGLLLRINALDPAKYYCPLSKKEIGDLESGDYTEHFLSCNHCGALAFILRHEHVAASLHKNFKWNGLYSQLNPKEYPIPGNSRGGPDVVLFSRQVYAFDVAVVKPATEATTTSSLRSRFTAKLNHYSDFALTTGMVPTPFVMSVYGVVATDTVNRMTTISSGIKGGHHLFTEIMVNAQFELLRGMFLGNKGLHARKNEKEIGTGQ